MMDSSFGGQRLCDIRSNTSISNHLPLNPLKTDANAFYGKIIPIAYTTYENQTWHILLQCQRQDFGYSYIEKCMKSYKSCNCQ